MSQLIYLTILELIGMVSELRLFWQGPSLL